MLGRWLLLPFFILGLGLSIFPTIIRLGIVKLAVYKPLMASLLLLFLVIGLLLIKTVVAPLVTTKSPLQSAKEYLELLNQKQPTHRDILLNLSRIHRAVGDETTAQQYEDQARQLDPNSELID